MLALAQEFAIEVRGLRKAFSGVDVLKGVNFAVRPGSVHALLGANGAGKSTLIGCLSGAHAPDGGEIIVAGIRHRAFTPIEAFTAGIAVIYQNLSVVGALSVSDNVFLGSELRHYGMTDSARQSAITRELLAQFGAPLDPGTPVSELSVGEQQLVEIVKALRHRPRVLILDEPTSALGEADIARLCAQVRQLAASGMAVIYVTHHLPELFRVADHVTVLRDGQVALSDTISALDIARIAAAIAPGAANLQRQEQGGCSGTELLGLRDFAVGGIGPLDLRVNAGEIVGVFGLLGSGRTTLLEGIYGSFGKTRGDVRLRGVRHVPKNPAASIRAGVSLVASDRSRQSVFASLSTRDNLMMPHFSSLARYGVRQIGAELREFGWTAARLRIMPARPDVVVATLSGGNAQKVVVGRWLSRCADAALLMLDEPTQGIDVGARADLYRLLREFVQDRGRGVLFASSDVEEVVALADRYVVLHRGRAVAQGVVDNNETELIALAHGSTGSIS